MKPGSVHIPQTALERDLTEAAALQLEMWQMLATLETSYAGTPVQRTGGWRQFPEVWDQEHQPKSPTINSPGEQTTE